MFLLTSEQMREYDRQTIETRGVAGTLLMENAGQAAVNQLLGSYGHLAPGPVLLLCGKGNNGGDGFVMARELCSLGWQVHCLVLAKQQQVTGDALVALELLLKKKNVAVRFIETTDQLAAQLDAHKNVALVVDALLGTGLESAVRGLAAEAIVWMNLSSAPVVAVDVPSGVNASTGAVLGKAVNAAMTVSFAYAKIGLVLYPGAEQVGDLHVVDIGIPQDLVATEPCPVRLETVDTARRLFPRRPPTGHKGTFGHLLVVAGSPGKTGAAALAAEAGLRVGSGLTTLATAAAVQPLLATKLTEVMTAPVGAADREPVPADFDQLLSLCRDKQALAIGPGLGTGESTVDLVCRLLSEIDLPMVVDADGLTALAGHRDLLKLQRKAVRVLTPHPGEMSRLTGLTVAEIEADRVGISRRFASENKVVLVLKGARTVTAMPDGSTYVNSSGNPGMASAGMGDVLTGMIGGLLSQGLRAGAAARLAVFWHGQAGDDLAQTLGDCGLLAGDMLRQLPKTRMGLLQNGDCIC